MGDRRSVGSLDVDERRLREIRRATVNVVCAAAVDAADATLLLDVLGLDPAEGKRNANVDVSNLARQAAKHQTAMARPFNNTAERQVQANRANH